ncbi:MAG: peptidyl-tRNA hydrolase [Deltaproteobacteria bacterium]|nr:peptidyl-tRNA hydrolase [Deltaproteobacteria bacterium]
MYTVVGLGNPGHEYAGSRHNVGFAVVDELARRWKAPLGTARRGVRVARAIVAGKHIALMEPQRYMNRSGPALIGSGRHINVAQLIVVHDDLDLEVGCVRVKRGGGTAGHHGLDSIVECFGRDFTRVRVGVGRPPRERGAVSHVLSRFSGAEREVIAAAITRAADAVECILNEGEERAMNTINAVAAKRRSVAAEPIGRN